MNQKTIPSAPWVVTSIFAISTLAVGAAIGFGVEMDNIRSAKIFRLSLIAALLVGWGVMLAARLSPRYAYLWLALILLPLPLGFYMVGGPGEDTVSHTLVVTAAPLVLGLIAAEYRHFKHKRGA